ncbi:1-phosphofructokinase [Allosaccharopolyspora coralli]|uniref:1-phosphofructokinase n=1 Tax=Allosaccharopolyspora coralli TaxID=2665642 RepID=A0A5Q3QE99_9PSEU|nr:1-phosphofructokinase [Allosaccharopolyspora coralli]QGK69809.1 1-phosphofructokinase [Allosaccharopolyspora coralli]
MILTVTPNPSLDRTILVDGLVPGAVHRTRRARVDPGGKGVNVARAVTAAGGRTLALLPAGGADGERLAELLAAESVPATEVETAQPTRSNLAVVEADGTTSKFNDPGPELTATELAALSSRVTELATASDWVVLCGSLPSGCPDGLHADLVLAAREGGARVAVDASGAPLAAACRNTPDVVKPNLAELGEWAGRRLDSLGDVRDAGQDLRSAGPRSVLVSLGEHGALLLDDAGAWHATSDVDTVRSTVGAGDAMLAGFLLGGGTGLAALRTAVAYGAAAVGLPGSRMPWPEHLRTETVRLNELDESLNLTGVAA